MAIDVSTAHIDDWTKFSGSFIVNDTAPSHQTTFSLLNFLKNHRATLNLTLFHAFHLHIKVERMVHESILPKHLLISSLDLSDYLAAMIL
jgi:hypothetical protein